MEAYEVVIVLEVAAHGHFASAIAPMHVPFAPVECISRPWCEVAAVGGHAVDVGKQCPRARGFVGHG